MFDDRLCQEDFLHTQTDPLYTVCKSVDGNLFELDMYVVFLQTVVSVRKITFRVNGDAHELRM